MSRVGRQPIQVPSGVTVTIENRRVQVQGPKGEQEITLLPGLKVEQAEGVVTVAKTRNNPQTQKSFGLTRTLVANMIEGVSNGFSKQLEINGVGYRAAVSGSNLNLSLGFSHPVVYKLPSGIEAKVDKNVITISGHDKQLVGQVAANLRSLKKPEPYKGKGIKYIDERIRRKAGKTAAKGA